MSNNEAIKMLKARLECVTNLSGDKCSYSSCADCHLCCEQGSLEEQKEYLDIAIKALEAWGKVKNICTIQVADTFRNFEEYDRGSHAREKIRSTCREITILLKEVSE